MRCNRGRGPIAGAPARSIRSFTGQSARQPASASRPLEPLYELLMADDATSSHLSQPLANQRVRVGVQFDVAGNGLVANGFSQRCSSIRKQYLIYVLQDIVLRRSSGVSDGGHTHTFARNATGYGTPPGSRVIRPGTVVGSCDRSHLRDFNGGVEIGKCG